MNRKTGCRTSTAGWVLSGVLGLVLFSAAPAQAAVLGLGEVSAVVGQSGVELPLSLTVDPGEQVSAFTVEIFFDPALLQWHSPTLDPTIAALGKQVEANLLKPGHLCLVVYGVDRQVLPSGPLATLVMDVSPSASPGSSSLRLRDGFGADPNGGELSLGQLDGRVWIESQAPALPFQELNGQVVMEAEHFHTSIARNGQDWVLGTTKSGYAGEGYLEALPNIGKTRNTGYVTKSPELIYEVDFTTTGTYYVWVRGFGASGVDDSIHAGLDGTGPSSADRISGSRSGWGWKRNTMDKVYATLDIATPGLHTIHLWMREDGFMVDKLLLINGATIPSGVGPAESPRVSGSPQADTVAPRIDNVTFSDFTPTGVTIAWTTDESARTTILLGRTIAFGITLDGEADWSNNHQAAVTGLQPETLYYCRIEAVDQAGNVSTANEQTFTTPPLPVATPAVFLHSPTKNSVVHGTSVLVAFSVEGAEVRGGAGYTHLHIKRDSKVWHVANTDPFLITGLTPGAHKISVMLADNVTHKKIVSDRKTYRRVYITVEP